MRSNFRISNIPLDEPRPEGWLTFICQAPTTATAKSQDMKFFPSLIAVAFLVAGSATGHPEEFTERVTGAELAKRQHLAHKRQIAARSCSSLINAFHAKRRVKRGLSDQLPLASFNSPSENNIQSYTCVTAPEIEEGPYYVNNELIRHDLREDQKGVSLQLDVGVIDTATCKPIPNTFIEIWSANATGVYGAFESNANGPGGPPGGPGRGPPNRDDPRPPHRPPGGPGGPPPGGPHGGPPMSSTNTWLRGGSATGEDGTVELWTIYPGFYAGRTIHVHLMVHMGWEEVDGTLVSQSGSLKHIGQLFFDETWNDKVLNTESYLANKGHRTLNTEDHDFNIASIDGSSAIVQIERLGEDLSDGLLGFITIGIDTTADYAIGSNNYNNVTDAKEVNM